MGSVTGVKIAFAADDLNECVAAVRSALEERAEIFAPTESQSWPEMSRAVADAVANGDADYGVLMCWTGTGTAIAANKVKGIRAAQAWEPWIAENARRWNDANVLTLSLKRTSPDVAVDCVNAFLDVDRPDEDEVETIRRIAHL